MSTWTGQVDLKSKIADPFVVFSLVAILALAIFTHTIGQFISPFWFVAYVVVLGLAVFVYFQGSKNRITRYVFLLILLFTLISAHIVNSSCEIQGGHWNLVEIASGGKGPITSEECVGFSFSEWFSRSF